MLDEAVVGRGGKNILKCFVDTDLILNRAKSLQISLSGYPLDPKVTVVLFRSQSLPQVLDVTQAANYSNVSPKHPS